jgi:hypothetical protein
MSKSQEVVAVCVVIDKLVTGRFTGREAKRPTVWPIAKRDAERTTSQFPLSIS